MYNRKIRVETLRQREGAYSKGQNGPQEPLALGQQLSVQIMAMATLPFTTCTVCHVNEETVKLCPPSKWRRSALGLGRWGRSKTSFTGPPPGLQKAQTEKKCIFQMSHKNSNLGLMEEKGH